MKEFKIGDEVWWITDEGVRGPLQIVKATLHMLEFGNSHHMAHQNNCFHTKKEAYAEDRRRRMRAWNEAELAMAEACPDDTGPTAVFREDGVVQVSEWPGGCWVWLTTNFNVFPCDGFTATKAEAIRAALGIEEGKDQEENNG